MNPGCFAEVHRLECVTSSGRRGARHPGSAGRPDRAADSAGPAYPAGRLLTAALLTAALARLLVLLAALVRILVLVAHDVSL
jgi:hypothetical protein